jgi:LPXTG-motif cell wall-anchored protein
MKQNVEKIKGHGYLRKTKVGLASGIVLGATLLLGAGIASADEVASPSSGNVASAQANDTKDVVVDNGLTKVVEEAKSAGLQVEKEPTKNIGTANTEPEAEDLQKKAEAEVEAQKKNIKDAQDKFVEENKKIDENLSKLKEALSQDKVYNTINNNLAFAQDYEYSKGNVKFGEISSSKGKVDFVAPESDKIELDVAKGKFAENFKKLSALKNSDTPKEVTYSFKDDGADHPILHKNSVISDKNNVKGIPVRLSPNETISYRVEFGDDSSLAKMGIKYKDVKLTLKSTGVNDTKSHSIGFLSPYGSTLLSGGVLNFWEQRGQLNGELFFVESSYNYLDKNGKVINKKELGKNWFTLGLAKGANVDETFFADGTYKEVHNEGDNTTYKSDVTNIEIGGTDFFKATRQALPVVHDEGIIFQQVQNASAPQGIKSELYTKKQSEKVAYHLVSYTKNTKNATNNTDKLKKGSIVQVFIEEGGKEIAPKTNTGEKPVDETVTLNHPKEILFEGKTYTFTKQDKADPTKIPNGQETITYIYKLKETPKPVVVEEKKGDVEVRYVKDDASKTVLKDPVADTVGGKVGSDYDTTDNKPKTITKDGVTYEFVRTEGVEKGKVTEGKTVVTYVYREVPKLPPKPTTPTPVEDPTTIHIDEDGNRIAPPEKGTKPFKNIDGYEPSPKNPKNVENPKGETVRVYKIVKGDVEVHYIKDDKERTVLKEPVADTTQAKVGTKYDTTDHKPQVITKDGVSYELVRTEGKETGDVVKGKTVVTYVYREVQKPVTIHIDKEGNPVAPKEDGTKPFKDIEGYKPEPKDPKNVEDPKGVTVRVYEKVTPKTPETPQETPKTPEAPKPQQPTQAVVKETLPHTGEVASVALTLAGFGLLGLSGLATKKKRED